MPNVYEIECNAWECGDDDSIYYYVGKIPQTCPHGHFWTGPATKITVNKDDFPIINGGVSPRPGWKPGRQKEIRERSQSIGGTITCGICGNPIAVNSDGKEEWTSVNNNSHETLPHTDHCWSPGGTTGGPWVHRKSLLESQPNYQSASEPQQKAMKRETFNESPLRVAHMSCNCSLGAN